MAAHYVGVYYPAALADNGVPGYALTHAQLMITAGGLVGKPITYEHRGIAAAVSRVDATKARVSGADVANGLSDAGLHDVACLPIGVVMDAWQAWSGDWLCAFRVSPSLFPRLCAMIDGGSLRGLSMSHLHNPAMPLALEMSLCMQPARPGSYVRVGPLGSPEEVQDYKARSMQSPDPLVTMSAQQPAAPAADSSAPEAPTMDSVLGNLPDEHRQLISAAFNNMDTKLQATSAENKKLMDQYSAIEKASQIDKKLLGNQIETFLGMLDDDTKKQFNLSPDTCKAGLVDETDVSAMRRNVDRMLMCCNAQFMARSAAASGANPRKRAAEPLAAAPPAAEAAQAVPVFDPATTSSPADALRAALSRFND